MPLHSLLVVPADVAKHVLPALVSRLSVVANVRLVVDLKLYFRLTLAT